MLEIVIQLIGYIALIFTLVYLWLIVNLKWWVWLVYLIGIIFWIVYAVLIVSYPVLLSNVVFGVVAVRGLTIWRKRMKEGK